MLVKLWQRLLGGWRRQGAQLDEAALAKAIVEHEQAAREKREPTELPPGRSNTDWTYVPPA